MLMLMLVIAPVCARPVSPVTMLLELSFVSTPQQGTTAAQLTRRLDLKILDLFSSQLILLI